MTKTTLYIILVLHTRVDDFVVIDESIVVSAVAVAVRGGSGAGGGRAPGSVSFC